jgi:Txe/YoeB family toxin of Txe-Axe toxin-antitoxin module
MESIAERLILIVCCVAFGVLIRDVAQDYRDIKREARQSKPRQSELDIAPVWSRRCEAQGKVVFATQSDGETWVIHCVTGRGKFT